MKFVALLFALLLSLLALANGDCMTAFSNRECTGNSAAICECTSSGGESPISLKFDCHDDGLTGELRTYNSTDCSGQVLSHKSYPIGICIRSTMYSCTAN
eukprot:TRINITY_DN12086_c0_g2_i1.p1 TRINITY_DN12086_c0_g2~~TRINITY_DN12086_c0_g2_i1.p1  ORF type:complete len:100 (+),score=4.27 TRINITY_DN12086_c0_g2_i1:292-591(+)